MEKDELMAVVLIILTVGTLIILAVIGSAKRIRKMTIVDTIRGGYFLKIIKRRNLIYIKLRLVLCAEMKL